MSEISESQSESLAESLAESPSAKSSDQAYRVLARKYRPQNFDELIGQDALVRTLKNAIETGRIAHAFMLTGVRGVGKTTTARIIAKALNYTGADGAGGPTTGDTDDCALCQAISADRHPDVIEMDAASRTGIDDIREILDGVRFAPSEARYKIYIIDEVHMLSKQAFNALLKTLEEPPEHVKFIFATTEIRKVPITVLSRCQRFDLRRVDMETLVAHFARICGEESVKADDEALNMIARAADGSVRDGLSLLDQGMALSADHITEAHVQDMLGLSDRARNMDLLEKALHGDMPAALEILEDLYKSGADPAVVIGDLLDITHIMTKLRAVPEAKEMRHDFSADHMKTLSSMATQLTMPTLGKTWQILLKGLNEVQNAPNPQSAAEIVLIRLVYAADLPDPKDLIKQIQDNPADPTGTSSPIVGSAPQSSGSSASSGDTQGLSESAPVSSSPSPSPSQDQPYASSHASSQPSASAASGAARALAIVPDQDGVPNEDEIAQPQIIPARDVKTIEDVVAVMNAHGEPLISGQIYHHVHFVGIDHTSTHSKLEIRTEEQADPKLAHNTGRLLSQYTDAKWVVSIASASGAQTLAQQESARAEAEMKDILQMPVIKGILDVFPEAKIADILRNG